MPEENPDGGATGGTKTAAVAMLTAGGCGCLSAPLGLGIVAGAVLIMGGLAVLLLPLVVIFMIFHGISVAGLGKAGSFNDDLTAVEQRCENAERARLENDQQSANRAAEIITGDGRGELELSPPDSAAPSDVVNQPCTVPEDLYQSIQDAGQVCDVIGPVTIAAQIQYESGFDAGFVGPGGVKGLSQVPTDVFTRLKGEDADPLDPKESISAQGSYLCELADQVNGLLDRKEITGNTLDLVLTAYDSGIDAVRRAKGVPATSRAQKYIVGVRTWFAPMEGVGPPPRKLADVPGLRDDGAGASPSVTPTAPTPTAPTPTRPTPGSPTPNGPTATGSPPAT
ncbi:lytic transglycosylase domain-containing protein [Streptomyces bauhiniae]